MINDVLRIENGGNYGLDYKQKCPLYVSIHLSYNLIRISSNYLRIVLCLILKRKQNSDIVMVVYVTDFSCR